MTSTTSFPRARAAERALPGTATRDVRPLVSVVVPAFNEAAIIAQTLHRLRAYLETIEHDYRWEIVVVNDGSSDDTGSIADGIACRDPRIRVLHHRTNFNLGQALRYAFHNCHGDYVVTLDSDLSYAPSHVGELLEAIRATSAKLVLASPYAKGGRTTGIPFLRRVLSRSANRFLSLMTRRQLATLTGMARVYDRRFLQSLDLRSTDVGINTEIIYKSQLLNARICEIPAHLDWTEQADGRRSSQKLTRSALTYVSSGFLFRPLAFFVVPGLLLLLLAVYTLAWASYRVGKHLLTGDGLMFSEAVSLAFRDAPHTFLVGGISLMLAVQLMSLGILAAQSKTYFEEAFHLGTSIYRRTEGWTWPVQSAPRQRPASTVAAAEPQASAEPDTPEHTLPGSPEER